MDEMIVFPGRSCTRCSRRLESLIAKAMSTPSCTDTSTSSSTSQAEVDVVLLGSLLAEVVDGCL